MQKKPRLSFWQIWNMSFGFLGIQFGFALQNGNASRILQTFGADVEHLSWFWLVAPLTGMIVQPIIGHYSDRTWNRLGRRRPYFLAGAVLASIALVLMPNADLFISLLPALWVGAGFLMIMDTSFNIAMEPFRALVADNLPAEQRTDGFAVQTFLIGIGAVVGSWLPYIFAEWLGIDKNAPEGSIPPNVVYSFYVGAAVFLATIIWTVIKTKEYPPAEYAAYQAAEGATETQEGSGSLLNIFKDFAQMPATMKQLGLTQFFSWFGLFCMWVYTTSAIAQHIYGLPVEDNKSETFQNAGNWVGVLFGIYNGVSAIYALLLPRIAAKLGKKRTHALSLIAGGLGLVSIYFMPSANALIIPMIGIGMAWASILAMPYALLAGSIPAGKMGIYMGLFNFFITLPQIVSSLFSGPIVKYFFGSQSIYALILGGVCMFAAAASVMLVKDEN